MRTLARQGVLGLTAGALALVGLTCPAHAAALSADTAGTVVEWGTGATDQVAVPDLGTNVISIDESGSATNTAPGGSAYGIAAKSDGTVVGWGTAGSAGRDGAIKDLRGVTQVSAAAAYALALSGGTIKEVGTTTTIGDAPAGSDFTQVYAGPSAGLALKSDGTITQWTTLPAGAVGTPPTGAGFVQVAATALASYALKADHTAVAWGSGSAAYPVPSAIQGHIVSLATGNLLAAAVLDDGSVQTWGIGAADAPAALTGEHADLIDVGSSIVVHTTEGHIYDWGGDASTAATPESLVAAPVAQLVAGPARHDLAVVTSLRNSAAPAISGKPQIGQRLSVTSARFNLTPSRMSTQWLANDKPIAGATGSSLTLSPALVGKAISVTQTATYGNGASGQTASATSRRTAAVGKLTASLGKLSIKPKKLTLAKIKKATATVTVSAAGYVPTGRVTLSLKKRTVTATLSGGKATFALKKLAKGAKKGKNKLTLSYAGDTSVTGTTGKVTIKVKK